MFNKRKEERIMNIFKSIIDSDKGITVQNFIICLVAAAVLGFVISLVHMYRTKYSQSFAITLALLPSLVAVIILMVNGNIGTGIAVAGAFSLTRFRSQPGTGREISSIFFAMVTGLACGTGYIALAVVFVLVIGALSMFYLVTGFGAQNAGTKELSVVIPENLDYCEIFDDLFTRYTDSHELVRTRTTNMGSMYKLKYEVSMKKDASEKKFMDEIRTRNGNLEVMLGRIETPTDTI